MNKSIYLKRYSTYSKKGLPINVEGNFPILYPSTECSFLSKKEEMEVFIENANFVSSSKTCEELGKLIDKKLFSSKPTSENEKFVLNKIIYGKEELTCYECLP